MEKINRVYSSRLVIFIIYTQYSFCRIVYSCLFLADSLANPSALHAAAQETESACKLPSLVYCKYIYIISNVAIIMLLYNCLYHTLQLYQHTVLWVTMLTCVCILDIRHSHGETRIIIGFICMQSKTVLLDSILLMIGL